MARGASLFLSRGARAVALAALGLTTVLLFGLGTFEAVGHSPWLLPLPLAALGLLALGVVRETRAAWGEPPVRSQAMAAAVLDGVAVTGAALVTYGVSVGFGLGPVLASGFVGLAGAMLAPKRAVAIYCGSFVGMASPEAFESVAGVGLSGAVAGGLFALSERCFTGLGGRLGAVAFVGSLASALLHGAALHSQPVPAWDIGLPVVACAVAAAALTDFLNVRMGHGPVLASAFVGVAAALLLPAMHGELGSTLAVVAFCASFVGMSSRGRLPNAFWAAMAGLVCGVMFLFTTPWLGGAGGKLGTLAFGSTIACWQAADLMTRIRERGAAARRP